MLTQTEVIGGEKRLLTTLGPRTARDLGLILAHEHIFVDLRPPDEPGHGQADAAEVVALMVPELQRARGVGITALVEATPVGVGRRADLVRAVSQAADFPLVLATGVYREPWIPAWVHAADEVRLREWMLGELNGEIEQSGVRAAWIKVGANEEGNLSSSEAKVLRAAAGAGAATGAVIGSHTTRGCVAIEQAAIVERAGYTAERFIWIHAQAEPDFALQLAMARRGAWIEYDDIGTSDAVDAQHVARILRMLDAGYEGHLLLSHDRGWFDPAQPGGGTPRPFTHLVTSFLPRLRAAGLGEDTIRRITADNPFRAFSR